MQATHGALAAGGDVKGLILKAAIELVEAEKGLLISREDEDGDGAPRRGARPRLRARSVRTARSRSASGARSWPGTRSCARTIRACRGHRGDRGRRGDRHARRDPALPARPLPRGDRLRQPRGRLRGRRRRDAAGARRSRRCRPPPRPPGVRAARRAPLRRAGAHRGGRRARPRAAPRDVRAGRARRPARGGARVRRPHGATWSITATLLRAVGYARAAHAAVALARPADGRGAVADRAAPAAGLQRAHPGARAARRRGRRALPPRALRRHRLPRRPRGPGHPAGGTGARRPGGVRRDDPRASVPRAVVTGAGVPGR